MFNRDVRDDFEQLRLKSAGRVWAEDDLSGGGVPSFVGEVTSPTSKIGVGDFLLVQPMFVMGPEVEGGSGNFMAIGSTQVPVYLTGPGKPATGDLLVCRFLDNRWVTERSTNYHATGGGTKSTGTLPYCFCDPLPATLTMISADPNCNYKMFQSCTIVFGPTPAAFAGLNLGPYCYLSTQGFPDPLANGSIFYYNVTCQYNQILLYRVYLQSPYGSPYRDGLLYSWGLGGYGNTCLPFQLENGVAYPGSDASCYVTIQGA